MRATVTLPTSARAGLAAAVALAPAGFQCARAFGERLAPEAPPDTVVWAARSVFLDRVGVATFLVAAAAAFAAPWLARRPHLADRALRACALVGALAGMAGGALHR